MIIDGEFFDNPHFNENFKTLEGPLVGTYKRGKQVNIAGHTVKTINELIEIVKVFQDTLWESIRVIYTNGSKIVGQNAVTSRQHNTSSMDKPFKTTKETFTYHKKKMMSLDADGYFILHNHPKGTAKPSDADINLTKVFAKYLPGFRGHLIISDYDYTFIDIYFNQHHGEYSNEFVKDAVNGSTGMLGSELNKNSIIELGVKWLNNTNTSILTYLNNSREIVCIQEVDNYELEDDTMLERVIRNFKSKFGAASVYLFTKNKDVASKINLIQFSIINNIFLFSGSGQHEITDVLQSTRNLSKTIRLPSKTWRD